MFRRRRRIILRSAAAASALPLLAILILWPLSYFRSVMIEYGAGNECEWRLGSYAGRIAITHASEVRFPQGLTYYSSPRTFADAWSSWSYADRTPPHAYQDDWTFLGCEYEVYTFMLAPGTNRRLDIPYGYPAILSAIAPALWLLTRRRRRRTDRLARGLCPICGYDLRPHLPTSASPTQNSELSTQNFVLPPRCPECGTAIPRMGRAGTPIS